MDIGFAELAYTALSCGVKKLEMGNQAMVFGAFAVLRKATIGFVMSVCRSTWKNSPPTGWIFIEFDIRVFMVKI
jgi:hypothetical protein